MRDRTKILNELRKGKTLDQLVEKFDMRKQTIKAMIELLRHQGHLKEVDCDSSCNNCSMGKSCPVPVTGKEKLYVVNEEERSDEPQ